MTTTGIMLTYTILIFGLGTLVGLCYEGCRRGGTLDLLVENESLSRGYVTCLEQRSNVIPFRSTSPLNPPKAGDNA